MLYCNISVMENYKILIYSAVILAYLAAFSKSLIFETNF